MGKRSPILGYNHNVRYRGLVFHVQTEDSGVDSPHLFTHLFHAGVIVSTRKLVYDAGSAEDAIKSLMQAQHKATLKDLRKGHFDDKIDSYLGGTPGLLPRGTEEAAERPGESELAPSQGTVEEIAVGASTQQMAPLFDEASAPTAAAVEKTPAPRRPSSPAVPAAPAAPVRAQSEPSLASAPFRPMPVDPTLKTAVPNFDSSAEIELPTNLEDSGDTIAIPRRLVRDTEMQPPFTEATRPTLDVRFDDHTRPTVGSLEERVRRAASVSSGSAPRPSAPVIPPVSSDSRRLADRPSSSVIPPLPSDSRRPGDRSSSPVIPPLPSDSRRLGDRPSTINAATLPPARPISRPPTRPAMATTPPFMARPATSDDRGPREPEIEVAPPPQQPSPPPAAPSPSPPPAPPLAELPPDERPGQYAQYKKGTPRHATEGPRTERSSAAVPIPAGLGRPQRAASAPAARSNPAPRPPSTPAPAPAPIPREPPPQSVGQTEPVQARAPTPARISPPGQVGNRSGTASGGVVMTRPAVIVGAPAKSVGTVPRIRKAREDEGRGFGQGLISEKSLDEVILAYLSEDADEK